MQNQMTSKEPLFVLVPIPHEVLTESGIDIGEALQFTVENGRITIEQIDLNDLDIVCDGNCRECPLLAHSCPGCCEVCPCNKNCERSEVR